MSGHERRVSSLSVTYQEEFHKPLPVEVPATKAPPPSAYASQGPADQTLVDICEEFQGLNDVHELNAPSSLYFQPQPPQQLSSLHMQQCTTTNALPSLPPGPPLPPWPIGNPLYGLEDGLRHKINIQIENFRASVQQTLCEQFNLHRFPPASNPTPQRLPVTSSESNSIPSTEPSQSSTYEGGDKNEDCSVQQNLSETDSCPGSYQNYSQEDNLYSSEASTSTTTVDSDIAEDQPKPSMEQQIDQTLIQLQMYASIITDTLRRAEYSI